MLSQDQVMGQLRQILPAIGWVLMLTGKVAPDTWGAFMAVVPPAFGALLVLGSAGWTLIANSRKSIVQSAAAMPDTTVSKNGSGQTTITIHDTTLADAALAAATPLNGASK